MLRRFVLISMVSVACLAIFSCETKRDENIPMIGFVDAFEDETIAQAKEGFLQALKDEGYSEAAQTIQIAYRNAQGDIPTLTQIVNYFISEKVELIASNTTIASITAIQKSKDIPVFMMVSGMPDNMMVLDADGHAPANLFGVGETVDYIDTSLSLIPKFIQPKGEKIVIGMIYNQAESQSQDALKRAKKIADKYNMVIEAMPVNSSADAQLVTQSLLNKNIDVFFANPDNVVFAAFETILKNCQQYRVPIFTSESGLVKRGAVAAYGADIYQWGYQSGLQAAKFLKSKSTEGLEVEKVKVRKYYYNDAVSKLYHFNFETPFEVVK